MAPTCVSGIDILWYEQARSVGWRPRTGKGGSRNGARVHPDELMGCVVETTAAGVISVFAGDVWEYFSGRD